MFKKKLKLKYVLLIAVLFLNGCSLFNKDPEIPNTDTIDSENRTITIVNKTNQLINEFYIYIGEGTVLEEFTKTNVDESSFSFKLSETYENVKLFSVVIIDPFGLKYGKENIEVNETGNTEIVISEENYVEQDGDYWKKLNKFLNGK